MDMLIHVVVAVLAGSVVGPLVWIYVGAKRRHQRAEEMQQKKAIGDLLFPRVMPRRIALTERCVTPGAKPHTG